MRLATDAGQQTRLFHFDRNARAQDAPSWQGHSVAQWTGAAPANPFGPARGPDPAGSAPMPHGGLKVVTTNLRSGPPVIVQ